MTSQGPQYGAPDSWGAGAPGHAAPGYPMQPYGQAPPYGHPQPQYGQPPYGYGYPYAPPQRTNGLAIASMVLGILWIYWLGSILALVFGYIARSQIRQRGEAGGGMAIAGIVLGWVGVGILLLGMVVGAAARTGY